MKRRWLTALFGSAAVALVVMGMVVMPLAETFTLDRARCDPTHPEYGQYESYRRYASEPCGWSNVMDWMWRQNYPTRAGVIAAGLGVTAIAGWVAMLAAMRLDTIEKRQLDVFGKHEHA